MNIEKILDQRLNELINLASEGISKISLQEIETYSQLFHDVGFVQIPSFINIEAIVGVYEYIIENASRYFVAYERPERPDFNRHLPGYRFKRVYLEPRGEIDISLQEDEVWRMIRERLKLAASQLSRIISPIIYSLEKQFTYDSTSIFYYSEGDYLGLHNDAQFYDRINAQLPLSINTAGCIRILYRERLRIFYDSPGCLNLLGPKTWHDVPPVLKISNDKKPIRMNLTMMHIQKST